MFLSAKYFVSISKATGIDFSSCIEKVGSAANLETDPEVLARLAKITEQMESVEKTNFIRFVPASEDCTWLIRRVREHGGKAGYF